MTPSDNTCANCRHKILQNFCPNCGQKKFQRIDRQYVKEEIQYSLLHTNKGFFYTIKNLIRNPGKTAKDFLNGNRVNHYKPILLAFILSGITTFITYKILNLGEVVELYLTENLGTTQSEFDITSFNTFSANYMSFFMMLLIPIAAILSYWIFKRQGNNYFEHIVINAYLYSFWALCTGLVLYPILYLIESPTWIVNLTFLSIPLFLPLALWFFKELYKELSWFQIFWKVVLLGVLGIIFYFLFSIFLGLIFAVYLVIDKGLVVL